MVKKRRNSNKNINRAKVNPQKAAAMANEALAFCRSGDYKRGIRLLNKALERDGRNDQITFNLAIAYHAVGDYTNAERFYTKTIKRKPEYIVKILQNGINELAMNKLDSAECCLNAVYEIDPDNPTAKLGYGCLKLRRGDRINGAKILRDSYTADPSLTSAIVELAEYAELTDADVSAVLRNIEAGAGQRQNDKFIYLALGKYYDHIGECTTSFEYFTKANQDFSRTANISGEQAANDLSGHLETLKQSVNAEYLEKYKDLSQSGEKLVFIVGLPKSGLHTAAYLLQESSKAVIAGELNWFNQKIYQMLQAHENNFNLTVNSLNADSIPALVMDYEKLIAGLKKSGKYVVNCKVTNFVNIWLMKVLFPKATIICSSREFNDQVLEIFFNNTPGMEYLSELSSIVKYCKTAKEMMLYWKTLYGEDIISFDYDKFLQNPQEVYSELMAAVGITDYKELTFTVADKPSFNPSEIFIPESSVSQRYNSFIKDIDVSAQSEETPATLDFNKFDTAGANDTTGFKLNFGTKDSSPNASQTKTTNNLKLDFGANSGNNTDNNSDKSEFKLNFNLNPDKE